MLASVPRDAARCGTGGFPLIIVPSLDLVIYKMGGNNGPSPRRRGFGHASGQYDPTLTDALQPRLRESREGREESEGGNKIAYSPSQERFSPATGATAPYFRRCG